MCQTIMLEIRSTGVRTLSANERINLCAITAASEFENGKKDTIGVIRPVREA